ncbi:MAG: acylphosphatase [Candidatus Omnitrophica bacterium]|nr:acylphosphatase [Candidatus Omnitrophota bacterium]MCM8803179.1 acylphosphatase [Candidatus Omnitrophota bacterium]
MKRYHLYVEGIVQGVGFRWYARRIGNSVKINGWVKNLPDGRVEIVIEGEEEKLEEFLQELKEGYLGENIKKIEKFEEEYTGEFKSFEIRF